MLEASFHFMHDQMEKNWREGAGLRRVGVCSAVLYKCNEILASTIISRSFQKLDITDMGLRYWIYVHGLPGLEMGMTREVFQAVGMPPHTHISLQV